MNATIDIQFNPTLSTGQAASPTPTTPPPEVVAMLMQVVGMLLKQVVNALPQAAGSSSGDQASDGEQPEGETGAPSSQLQPSLFTPLTQTGNSGQSGSSGQGSSDQGSDRGSASGASGQGGVSGQKSTSGETSLEQAMSSIQAGDPTLFDQIQRHAKSGNGNALVLDELKAYKDGHITRDQAIQMVSTAQKTANDNGGGKINPDVKNQARDALGGDYIHGGDTRLGHIVKRAFDSFTPVGAVVKGVQDKTAGKPDEDVIQAAQPALAQSMSKAMADMRAADPQEAAQFQADAKAKKGNNMVEDMIKASQDEGPGGAFTDDDAKLLGSQIGDFGAGKVSDTEDDKFANQYGDDTLYRGSGRATKGWNKFEDTVGGIMQKVVSPVTDTVVATDKFFHGDIKGAFKTFGEGLLGGLQDLGMVAGMIVAPEVAAPAIVAGEVGADVGVGAAEAGTAAVEAGTASAETASTSTSDIVLGGAKAADKVNDAYGGGSDVYNMISGQQQPQQQQQQPAQA